MKDFPTLLASFRLFWRDFKLFRVAMQEDFPTLPAFFEIILAPVQNSSECHWLFSEFVGMSLVVQKSGPPKFILIGQNC